MIANRLIALRNPLEALVVNISTDGILIRTSNAFNIGTTFQLRLNIGEKETLLNTSVVRISFIDTENTEYGCIFNYVFE